MAKKKEMELPSRSASSQEERENIIINEAYDEAERRILSGNATSQLLTHFLRMGSERERTEREILRSKNELMRAQTEAVKNSKRDEASYAEVIAYMKRYAGESDNSVEDEYYGN